MCISFLFSFAFNFFFQLLVRPPQRTILPFCIFFLGIVLITAFHTMSWTSVHSYQALGLSDLIPWICLSLPLYNHKGFGFSLGSSYGKGSACSAGSGFDSWVGKIPWRRKWQPTAVYLPGEFQGQRDLVGYRPWDGKESDTTEHTHLLPLSHDCRRCPLWICTTGLSGTSNW